MNRQGKVKPLSGGSCSLSEVGGRGFSHSLLPLHLADRDGDPEPGNNRLSLRPPSLSLVLLS